MDRGWTRKERKDFADVKRKWKKLCNRPEVNRCVRKCGVGKIEERGQGSEEKKKDSKKKGERYRMRRQRLERKVQRERERGREREREREQKGIEGRIKGKSLQRIKMLIRKEMRYFKREDKMHESKGKEMATVYRQIELLTYFLATMGLFTYGSAFLARIRV